MVGTVLESAERPRHYLRSSASPELFALLHMLVDRPGSTARFLVLSSTSPI